MAIEDEGGAIKRGDVDIGQVAESYFTYLFKSTRTTSVNYQTVFDGFQSKVTAGINEDLIRPVTEEEIIIALFNIRPDRAPGPDGFTGAFFQQFWPEIKTSICDEIQYFFDHGKLKQATNHTNLCLIPKIDAPRKMSDFRPIALCNVRYKIIYKILV